MGKYFKPVKIDRKRIPDKSVDSTFREVSARVSGLHSTIDKDRPQRSPDFIGDWIKDTIPVLSGSLS